MSTESISILIRSLVEQQPDADADTLAAEALDAVKLAARLRPVFFALVRDECRREIRDASRRAESTFDLHPTKVLATPRGMPSGGGSSAIVRPDWMRARFTTSRDGRFVTWAEATAEDHQARIDMQLDLARGIQRDIDRHADAIKRIKACPGATCLADLPEYGGNAGKVES